jgi:2-keto-4-pentenoate hydratase/2-oxohepta-3-ene-1,7-dioic acid hydratase in catechol pathway
LAVIVVLPVVGVKLPIGPVNCKAANGVLLASFGRSAYIFVMNSIPITAVSYLGSGAPVRVGKIMCLGRNYREHAKEMQAEIPAEPVVFLKPATALLGSGGVVRIPSFSRDVHHEVEIVALISTGGCDIPRTSALDHVGGYAVGLDMTARDVQSAAKKKGLPWAVSKGFDTSAPVSPFIPSERVPDPGRLEFSLSVNGTLRQRGTSADMLFSVGEIVAYLSTVFTLEPGDLIFTGTPEGVAPIAPGDRLEARLADLVSLSVTVA